MGKTYEAHCWVQEIFKLGFNKFFFSDLPEKYQNKGYLLSAKRNQIIRPTKIEREWCPPTIAWEIRPDILDIRHDAHNKGRW